MYLGPLYSTVTTYLFNVNIEYIYLIIVYCRLSLSVRSDETDAISESSA